ncbi:MAG: PHP domain-containing protein [Cyanobacteria bacterium P01_C01_bin.73]
MTVNPALVASTTSTMAQDTLALQQVFQSVHAESCPLNYNFHMHTVCSDGRLKPEALVEQVIELGLKGFAITDHHSVQGYQRAKAWLEDWQWRHPKALRQSASVGSQGQSSPQLPRLWTGIEITACLVDTDVHILGFAFKPAHDAIQPYLNGPAQGCDRMAEAVIHAIQAAGGLAVLAHPARYRTKPTPLITAAAGLGIDGVETYYAYDRPEVWRPSPAQTETVEALAKQFGLLKTCGTDTHGLSLLRRI